MYCLANEEMPRSEIKSLLTLLEQIDIKEKKYLEIRAHPQKILPLIARISSITQRNQLSMHYLQMKCQIFQIHAS